jgi:hypothetical protein
VAEAMVLEGTRHARPALSVPYPLPPPPPVFPSRLSNRQFSMQAEHEGVHENILKLAQGAATSASRVGDVTPPPPPRLLFCMRGT